MHFQGWISSPGSLLSGLHSRNLSFIFFRLSFPFLIPLLLGIIVIYIAVHAFAPAVIWAISVLAGGGEAS